MIHALHMMEGTAYPEDKLAMSIYKSKNDGLAILYYHFTEELRTVGLDYYPLLFCVADTGKKGGFLFWAHNDIRRSDYKEKMRFDVYRYTENALRTEQGLPLRISYILSASSPHRLGMMAWDEMLEIFPDYSFPKYPD